MLDASAAFRYVVPGEESSPSLAGLLVEDEAVVIALWPFEVANAVRRSEIRGRMTPEEALLAADALGEMPVIIDGLDVRRVPGAALARHGPTD